MRLKSLKFENGFDFVLASGVALCKVINRFENLYRYRGLIVSL